MLVGTGTSKGKQAYLRMVSQLADEVAFGACHKESTVQFTRQQLAGSLGSGQGLPIAAGVIGIHADCLQEGRKQHTQAAAGTADGDLDRKSTRLNSSHVRISYAVFCL